MPEFAPLPIRFAVLALLASLLAPAAGAEAPLRLKVATLAPHGSLYHRVLQDIGTALRANSPPGSSVTVYTDGSQGSEADVVRRIRVGQLNAAMISVVGLSEIDDSVNVLQKMPLLFRNGGEVEHVASALRPEIERRLAAKGFVAVLWSGAGWVRFFTTAPASVPAELRTRKVFAWSGDPEQVQLMKQLGYRPVVLETADIVPGLQTGLVDTVPLTPMWALATQADLLAPYMIDVPWAPITGAIVVAKPVWDALTPAARAAVQAAAARAAIQLRDYQERSDREAIAAMQARGLHVVHLDAAEQAAWAQFAEQLYPLLRGRTVPAATYDSAVRLLAEYRATHPAGPRP